MGQLCLSDFMASTAVFNGALSASPSFVLMGALSARSCEIITQLCLMGGYVCLMAPAVFNGALSASPSFVLMGALSARSLGMFLRLTQWGTLLFDSL